METDNIVFISCRNKQKCWLAWLTPGTVDSLSMSDHGTTDGKPRVVGSINH